MITTMRKVSDRLCKLKCAKPALTIIILSSSFLFTISCCKGPYPVAGIKVTYPNLSSTQNLKAVRAEKNNFSVSIDTVNIGELNSSNNYSLFLEFENNPPDYQLFIENTNYIDTISAINIERKGCSEKIKLFEYKLNGKLRTEQTITIE